MPQINSGKSPPWVAGEIVTAAELNQMIDAATLDPSVITAKTDLATLTGDEYALIVDTTGALRKTQLKNSLMAGSPIETNYIGGYSNVLSGARGTLQIQAQEGFVLSNGDSAYANSGLLIQSTGGNITLNATNSGYGHGNGVITLSSGTGGFIFTSSGTGTASFSQRTLFNTVGAIKLPVGTTLQRPAAPVTGDFRFNTTTLSTEIYDGSIWSSDAAVRIYTKSGIATGDWLSTAGTEKTVYQTPTLPTPPTDETWTYTFNANFTGGDGRDSNTRSAAGMLTVKLYKNTTVISTQVFSGGVHHFTGTSVNFSISITSADVGVVLSLKALSYWTLMQAPCWTVTLTKNKTAVLADASSCI